VRAYAAKIRRAGCDDCAADATHRVTYADKLVGDYCLRHANARVRKLNALILREAKAGRVLEL
jgi:hypothetical protein